MTSNDGSGAPDLVLCSNGTIAIFMVGAGLNSALASVVTVCAFLSLLVTAVFLKKYRFHVQRLVMYLNGCIFLQGISSILDGVAVILITVSTSGDTNSLLCMASAYLFNHSLWMEVIMIWWITLDLLLMAVFSLFTNRKMELIQLATAMLIPMSILWVPFLFDSYGIIDGRCDLITLDTLNCSSTSDGFTVFLLFRLLPFFLLLVVIFAMYIIIFCQLHKSRNKHRGMDNNSMGEVTKLRGKVRVLIGYPVIYAFFYLLPSFLQFTVEYSLSVSSMDTSSRLSVVLIVTIMQNVGAILISISFTFDRETCRHLRRYNIAGFWKNRMSSRGRVETMLIPYVSWGDSLHGNCEATTNT